MIYTVLIICPTHTGTTTLSEYRRFTYKDFNPI